MGPSWAACSARADASARAAGRCGGRLRRGAAVFGPRPHGKNTDHWRSGARSVLAEVPVEEWAASVGPVAVEPAPAEALFADRDSCGQDCPGVLGAEGGGGRVP